MLPGEEEANQPFQRVYANLLGTVFNYVSVQGPRRENEAKIRELCVYGIVSIAGMVGPEYVVDVKDLNSKSTRELVFELCRYYRIAKLTPQQQAVQQSSLLSSLKK